MTSSLNKYLSKKMGGNNITFWIKNSDLGVLGTRNINWIDGTIFKF